MGNLKKLPEIIRQCMTIGELPTSYKISLTYEEQLLWFCHFLENEVIPVVNNNSQVVEELKNYFENLDVQEEINNKLDEMAESGELTEIIAQYLQLAGILVYNNVTELKNAENLINGSFTKTFGKITYNDGMGAFYKIREIQNTDIIDNENIIALVNYPELVAEKIQEIKDKINVKRFGIEGNNIDVTENLQNLINKLGSQTYFFPKGIYYFKNINPPSNCKLIGEEGTKFIIPTNEEIVSNFYIENKENISFENIYFQNAENSNVGTLYGDNFYNIKACIFAKNSSNIKINNCIFNKFFYGFQAEDTNNVIISNSKFSKSGYGMIFVFNNSKNYKIINCEFDTAYTNVSNNLTYMIAFTSSDFNETLTFPENITIENCDFKNNLYWESIDTHGANNIKINNCNFYNVYAGITLFNDQRFVNRHLQMHDIIITNNRFNPNNLENATGLIISGAQNGLTDGYMLKNVIITNNIFENFYLTKATKYVIYLDRIENFNFNNNVIETNARNIRTNLCIKGTINNNNMKTNATAPISVTRTHLVTIQNNNIIMENEQPNAINPFEPSNIFIKDNVCNCSELFVRAYGNVDRYATFGQPLLDWTTLRPLNKYVTSKNVYRNAQLPGSSTIKITGTADSDIVSASENLFNQFSLLQYITILGAGENGGDLTVYIKECIDDTHFKISSNILTSVSSATIQVPVATFQT
ncbi:MAG: right-handed parallel beta-helix repeat-containing protein [Clostridia bacterium]